MKTYTDYTAARYAELDARGIRGAFDARGIYTGFDYRRQMWINTSPDAQLEPAPAGSTVRQA